MNWGDGQAGSGPGEAVLKTRIRRPLREGARAWSRRGAGLFHLKEPGQGCSAESRGIHRPRHFYRKHCPGLRDAGDAVRSHPHQLGVFPT